MFVNFYYHLRHRGLSTSPTEFLDLLDALNRGIIGPSLERFYALGRALLVKRVEQYDIWDQAFAEFFRDRPFDLESPQVLDALHSELLDWLKDPKQMRDMTPEEVEMLKRMESLQDLREQFEQRLKEQHERHDGGSHWVGTGGTSPFGHGGQNPSGVRVGGEGGGRSAVQVAMDRQFKNLRTDLKLDVRQISLALRKLRQLTREGRIDELDIDATIDATASNAGDLELVWRPPRKNHVKLLLLMDVGGSMTPYARTCSLLFSAAHQATHFKEFESYYFHNCPYDKLYKNMAQREAVDTKEVLKKLDRSWRCIIVGDAAMAPTELMEPWGIIHYNSMNAQPGIWWLNRLKEVVPRTVWLNPDPVGYWGASFSTRKIRTLFDMYPLTLDGLDRAVNWLRHKRV